MEGLLLSCVLRVSARGTQHQRCTLRLLTSCALELPQEMAFYAGACRNVSQSRRGEGVTQEAGQLKR
jgi:hypothetical protein